MIRILNVEPDGYSSEARSILASAAHVDERMLDRRALLAEISRYDALIVRLRHQVDKELLKSSIAGAYYLHELYRRRITGDDRGVHVAYKSCTDVGAECNANGT